MKPSTIIEDFADGWQKEWFTKQPSEWARTTLKLGDETWQAPPGARLALDVRSTKPNIVVVLADDMGSGDVSSNNLNGRNPNGRIQTPNIDRLAKEGVRFTWR